MCAPASQGARTRKLDSPRRIKLHHAVQGRDVDSVDIGTVPGRGSVHVHHGFLLADAQLAGLRARPHTLCYLFHTLSMCLGVSAGTGCWRGSIVNCID